MPPITTRHSLITNNCLSTNVPHELGHPHPTGNVGIVRKGTMSHRWPGNVGWRHIWRSVWKAAPGSWRTVWVRWRPESPPAPLETSPAVPWKRDNINTHKMMFKTHSFVVVVFFWGFFAFSNKWASPLFDCRFLARTSVSLWWPEREDAGVHTVGSFSPPIFFLKYKYLSWNNNNSNVILYISASVVDVKHFHDKLRGGMKNECHTKMTDRRSCA